MQLSMKMKTLPETFFFRNIQVQKWLYKKGDNNRSGRDTVEVYVRLETVLSTATGKERGGKNL